MSDKITNSVGSDSVDSSVIPYMRAREVEFAAYNLRPYRAAQMFFGDINVTRFCQRASRLIPDTANAGSALTSVIRTQERFYCNSTHCFASAIGAANGSIYINENYISVNVSTIGANTLGASDYAVGDIVYQVPTGGTLANPTFEAKVAYWNSSDGVIVLEPLLGVLNVNSSVNTVASLFKSGADISVRAASIVVGNRFPTNAIVSSLDNVSNRFLVNTYDHFMGIVSNVVAPNANCVIVSGTVPADAVGNIFFITAQTGLGKAGLILSVSGNVVYTNTTFSPYPTGNSYYSIGANKVDETGHLFGVYNIPETATVQFLTGSQKFTINDSTIVDDPDSTMVARGHYVSAGYLGSGTSTVTTPVVQPSYESTAAAPPITSQSNAKLAQPTTAMATPGPSGTYSGIASQVQANTSANGLYNGISTAWPWAFFDVDPIAQTFTTPPPKSSKSNYGIFVSSVDLWFQVKPTGQSPKFPVQLLIAECVNGVPTSNVLASVSVQWEDIKISDTPDAMNVGSSIASNQTSTKFRFADPVYLQAASQYALIIYTESPDYEVWVGNVGDVDQSTAGNGTRRISSQPNVGSFFKSQNASVWTPYQNRSLMFVLNKAVFSTAPVSFNFNMSPVGGGLIPYDKLLLNSSDLSFSSALLTYKVRTALANTFAQEAAYQQVTPGSLLNFSQDLKTSSINSTRRRLVLPGNNQSLLVQVSMQTTDPDVSPVFNAERLSAIATTHIINAGGVNSENISITRGGIHANAANIVVTVSAPDIAGGIQATANVPVLNPDSSVPFITMLNPGSGYSVAPTITLTEAAASLNATAVVGGEDGQIGGNGVVRYVSRKITLANGFDAGDLRIYLNAIRPAGTDIGVYYKVLSSIDTQSFINIPWRKMALVQDVDSPDQSTPIRLTYCPSLGPNGLPSGKLSYTVNNVQYPLGGSFKFFAIKIVLFANDPTVPPMVNSMQIVALPAG